MRTPEGWHKAWHKNAALFQNTANTKKHAPTTARSSRLRVSLRSLATPWPAASLRSSPLYVGLRCVASLRRSGLNFLFLRYPGFRGYAAPPPGYYMAPLRGSKLGSPSVRNLPFNFRFIDFQITIFPLPKRGKIRHAGARDGARGELTALRQYPPRGGVPAGTPAACAFW